MNHNSPFSDIAPAKKIVQNKKKVAKCERRDFAALWP